MRTYRVKIEGSDGHRLAASLNVDRIPAQWQREPYVPTTGAPPAGHTRYDPMQPWAGPTTVAGT